MKQYTITDQDLEDLKCECDDFEFWDKFKIQEWIDRIRGTKVPSPNYQQIVNSFNYICKELPKVGKLTDHRKSAISARIKEHSLEVVIEVFNITAESNYLSGRIKNWKASFDWVMNPNNFVKILEGNYKNINNVGDNNHPKSDSDTREAIHNSTRKYISE